MKTHRLWIPLILGIGLLAAGLAYAAAAGVFTRSELAGLPLDQRYARATTWDELLAQNGDEMRRWRELYEGSGPTVSPLLEDVRALPGQWKLLAVTENWCGDSRNTLPYLARLADESGNLELRMLRRADAPDLLAAYPLPDGREAIPLILVLDADHEVQGAWVERPRALQALIDRERAAGTPDIPLMVLDWYARDAGRTALAEILQLIEPTT